MSTVGALPLALQPWSTWLQMFSPDIAATLGDLLLRLDPLLGRGQVQMPAPSPLHDGLGGIERRGPYERLLLSEWGMADAVPDEFLRRAAAGEHLFLAPRSVERQADTVVIGLFDAGPLQWGAPRLLQVAMWILLARRARGMRARFLWGMAHTPGELSDAETPEALLRLLQSRTPLLASGDQWAGWSAYLQREHGQGERWLCADRPVAALDCTHIALARIGMDGQLHVRVGRRGSERSLLLPVPASGAAARLLRGEFRGAPVRQAADSKHRFSRQQRPVFSLDGQRVVVPLLGHRRAFQLDVPAEGQARRKRNLTRYHEWSAGMDLLSGLMVGKEFCGVLVTTGYMRFWKMQGLPRELHGRPDPSVMTVRPGLPQLMAGAMLYNAHGRGRVADHELLLLDHDGRLLGWKTAAGPRLVASNVLALHQVDEASALCARFDGAQVQVGLVRAGGAVEGPNYVPTPQKPGAVWLARQPGPKGAALVAVQYQQGGRSSCRLVQLGDSTKPRLHEVSLWQDWKPQGLVAGEGGEYPDRLLVLRADRRALLAVNEDGPEVLYTSSTDISTVSVSADGGRVALVDLAGNLRVLGNGGRSELATVRGTEKGDD